MGAYTANYMLYLCALGERGWGDRVNENFETIDNELKEHTEAFSAHKSSHEEINGELQCTRNLVVPDPYKIHGKVSETYTFSPVYPLQTACTFFLYQTQSVFQIFQAGIGQTISGRIPMGCSNDYMKIIFVSSTMDALSTVLIPRNLTAINIPEGTSGIYAQAVGAYQFTITVGKFTIS